MKIGLISLGCPKNLVDSEVMLGLAHDAGHELTDDPAAAEVLVVNTCAFIDSAKQESIDAILEMAGHKKDRRVPPADRRPAASAERYREELRSRDPEIDAVLGTGEVPEIVSAIGGAARASDRLRSGSTAHPAPSTRAPSRQRSQLHLRCRHAAPAGDPEALRLREDCGRVRLQVRVLHHSDTAGRVPKPPGRFDCPRSARRSPSEVSKSCC